MSRAMTWEEWLRKLDEKPQPEIASAKAPSLIGASAGGQHESAQRLKER